MFIIDQHIFFTLNNYPKCHINDTDECIEGELFKAITALLVEVFLFIGDLLVGCTFIPVLISTLRFESSSYWKLPVIAVVF